MEIGTILGVLLLLLALSQFGKAVREVKPNPSFMKQVPAIEEIVKVPEGNRKKAYELFTKLYQKNPELAEELGRIPDFADNEISDRDSGALVNMVAYYLGSKNPRKEEAVEQMLNVGIKEERAYCSPLEALKWLAEKHKFKEGSESYVEDPLSDYHLSKLISAAWDFGEEERWGDFKRKVTKRLSSPGLLSLCWVRKPIRYIPDKRGRDVTSNPTTTWGRGGGDCEDLAWFFSYNLGNAGYKTYIASPYRSHPRKGHAECIYEDKDGIWYKLTRSRGLEGYSKDRGFKDYKGAAYYVAELSFPNRDWSVINLFSWRSFNLVHKLR